MTTQDEPQQRVISQPIELQKLSLVNKQQKNASSTVSTPTIPKKPINMQIPITSPVKPIDFSTDDDNDYDDDYEEEESYVMASPTRKNQNATDNEDLIYQLASKQREITELEALLNKARDQLKSLEIQFRDSLPRDGPVQLGASNKVWLSVMQRKINEVNNSPNVIRGKKSISNFFTNTANTVNAKYNNMQTQTQTQRPVPPPPSRSKTRGGTFLSSLVEKFNEFNVDEAEEDEFDESHSNVRDKFYLKEQFGCEEDEDVEDTIADEPLHNMESIPASVFQRYGGR
ncbi:hypothetical protein NCAS_0E03060 [Naumovozyma castellii]|uniref:Uncharacterized protein n=1 Tax=Naumovozyma castellii TaxID=27288 RepID=G0VFV7_NAUCA|nr:hypothetical protein NCAS_0E03060 [Naumovozyma castellii CBS 4309]CCC70376.1 hypothetical protein NCAS_0E03060 [Naumovozyma castellii CBS 4309]